MKAFKYKRKKSKLPAFRTAKEKKYYRERAKGYNSMAYKKARLRVLTKTPYCQVCHKMTDLEVHHIDHDTTNNKDSNLMVLCTKHHAERHKLDKNNGISSIKGEVAK